MKPAASRARRLIPLVLLVVWLGIGGALGPFAGRLGEVSTDDRAAFLPQSAESTRVSELQERFRTDGTVPAVVVWVARDGSIGTQQREAAARALTQAADVPGAAGKASPPLPSEDGQALQGVVQLRADLGKQLGPAVERIRAEARDVPGTDVHLAGPAASQKDLSEAFEGIDGILLGAALGVVLAILLLVYRSVLLPLVVITGAVFALALACAIVYHLAERDLVRVDGQVQGILSILVIGAATDYALLLTARFREELAARGDRFRAVRAALTGSFGAITASAATVALGLLALLLSDLTNNRALGPVGAIGIACAVLSALTFLPAVLALLGSTAFWPVRPRRSGTASGNGTGAAAETGAGTSGGTGAETGAETGSRGLWARAARAVDRRPRRIWAATLALLVAGAAFAPQLDARGVPLNEIFVNDAPSVAGQRVLGEHFPGGSGNPALVLADADRVTEVGAAARGTEGVASAVPLTPSGRPGGEPAVVDGRVLVNVTLRDGADSDAAKDTVVRLRDAVHAVPGADALVGGYTAQQYDTQQTAVHDRDAVIPVVLAIILVILVALLRCLLLPLILVVTVALNYAATMGVSALVFTHLLGFSGTDASVPLYGFVFLVALGVDYNIFLMTRVREEALRHGTRTGTLRGLTATGGVITSAGVVLAATFAALVVIPLAFLVQIAFIVAFGVLLDTLVVRSFLVPALVRDLGSRVWWPVRSIRD